MYYQEKKLFAEYPSLVESVSYAGNPIDNTAMYVTKKVEYLLKNLEGRKGCLVFVEDTINVPAQLLEENVFVKTPSPQKAYAEYVNRLADDIAEKEKERKYSFTEGGYYLGENTVIGADAVIGPGCLIGHDVIIGSNAVIQSGARLQHCIIGDHFIAGENCTVGTNGFTMTDNDDGNKIRIPTLGKVQIGNNVEVGALTNISRGSAGNTVLEDNVKIDSLVHVGHDAHIHRNVEIPASAVIGGFDELFEGAYVGINATLRNRIQIGANVTVGMGSVVTKSFLEEGITIAGNPARLFEKRR